MRHALLSTALFAWLAIANGHAQDQPGRIEGTVVDAVSHQPIKKASVSIIPIGGGFASANLSGVPGHSAGQQSIVTDASGAFAFGDLAAGKYQLSVINQNYPQTFRGGARKTVDVSANDAASSVTIELMPGATISGHIVDEDGDPMVGCFVQPHPAKNVNQGVPMQRAPITEDDGSYRITSVPAGKYIISAQCSSPVFQPRPLSAGPDPPPASAYPAEYYSATTDWKSAQVVELSAGAEKSGIDFQMRPVSVTHIHGTFTGGIDWHGHGDMNVQLLPLDAKGPRAFALIGGAEMNADGSFDIQRVFPGSYQIMAMAQPNAPGAPSDTGTIGGVLGVDVADKPLNVSVQLHQAMDIKGKVELEGDNNSPFPITQINIQLLPSAAFGPGSAAAQPNNDGTFTLKSVLPGEYRIRIFAPRAFLKSARVGSDDVTSRSLNLTSGAAGALDLVVSTNTAAIQGTAPVGETVFAAVVTDDQAFEGRRGNRVDSNGHFKMEGLAPGKYRIAVGESGGVMPDGGQEVTIAEGETATIELKDEDKP